MRGMDGPSAMHDMHGMYAPPVDTHSLLTAWPVSLVGAALFAVSLWSAWRALAVWRRGAPRSPSWLSFAGLAVVAGLLGLRWAVITPHGSPFAYATVVVVAGAG